MDPFERDRGRLARYRERREFYEGGQWLGRPRRRQAQLTVNYARALVRKVVSYALPDGVGFTVPVPALAGPGAADGGHGGEPPAGAGLPGLVRARRQADEAQANDVETLLADLLAELDADRLDFALAIDSAVLGDGVIKVTWDVAASRPRLTAVDPATLLAWWSPDTPTEAYRFAQHYQLPGQAITALGWAADGALAPDRLYPVVEDWTGERWTVTVAGQMARDEANPYGWLPYLVLPNNASGSQFWGESDLDDLMDVCRQLNTRVSALADILDLAGWPITVLENVDSAEGITVGPGARWELPEGAKAYLLNLLKDGGVEQHVAYLDELRTALHDLAETPRTAFGEAGRAIAGAALQVELQPLVQKVKRKRRGLESLYRRRNAMLLDLMERFGGAPVGGLRRTTPVWPPILPNDREAEARIGVQLVNAGVRSRRSVAADLGEEDPDAEMARIVAEARRMAAYAADANDGGHDAQEASRGDDTHADREQRTRRPSSQQTGAADEDTP
ncbi:MAG: phage portal protein [Thermomicrobiales bacterium]